MMASSSHILNFSSTIQTLTILLLILKANSSPPPPSPASSVAAPTSIYELLSTHALPMGLFPDGISEYEIDNVSGRFELRRTRPCAAKFETNLLYGATVTGTLSYGQISDLSGVAAQELFLWLPVKSIRVDVPSSGLIYFDVGVVNKQFSLSFFETPRGCAMLEDDGFGEVMLMDDLARIVQAKSGKVLKKRYQTDDARRTIA